MGYADLIEKLRVLPRDKQAVVFDFVDYLAARFAADARETSSRDEWIDSEFSAMRQALLGIEDDAVSYRHDDLNERWR